MDPKTKWNKKHEVHINRHEPNGPNPRLQNLSSYLTGGRALDLACGLGENSLFLGQLRYEVEALDISEVAIRHLQELVQNRQLSIHTHVCDLTKFNDSKLKKHSFDLVIITYYLDRSIFPVIRSLLTKNGYFFMETFYKSPLMKEEGISPQYKLSSRELLEVFCDMKVLYYEENEYEGRQTIFVQNNEAQN